MRFFLRFILSALRTGLLFLAGTLLLAAVYPSVSGSLSTPVVSFTKEGWMRGTLTVLGETVPVDLWDTADFFSRFRSENAPDGIERALTAVSSDISRAFFRAFDPDGTLYVPEDAVLT